MANDRKRKKQNKTKPPLYPDSFLSRLLQYNGQPED